MTLRLNGYNFSTRSTENKKKCCLLHLRQCTPTASTHNLCLINATTFLAGDLRCRHTQHSPKQIKDVREQQKQIGTNKWLCCFLPALPPCIPMSLCYLCVLPQMYGADLANSGGSSTSKGSLPSLQSELVKYPTATGFKSAAETC